MRNPATLAMTRVKGLNIPGLNKFLGLMRREFLDHKTGFVWVPGVFAAFMIFGFISSAVIGNSMMDEFGVLDHIQNGQITVDGKTENIDDAKFLLERLNGMDIRALDRAMGIAMIALLSPLFLLIPFIITFGLLGSLYDDRRDRSVLFWKSMPVGDTNEVLSKLFAMTVMGPAVIIGFAAVVQVLWMIITIIQATSFGLGGVTTSFMWNQVPTVSLWIGMLSMVVLSVIWALPIIGWFTFVSSIAKKAPLLVALVPIGAIVAMEAVFNKSTVFIKWVVDRMVGWAVDLRGLDFDRIEVGDKLTSPFIGGTLERLGEGMATGEFWISTAIGVGFIGGAIYMRRHNA